MHKVEFCKDMTLKKERIIQSANKRRIRRGLLRKEIPGPEIFLESAEDMIRLSGGS